MKRAPSFTTTCCYCGVGCGMTVYKDKKGQITVEGDAAYPVNKGMLCSKGMNLHILSMTGGTGYYTPRCVTTGRCLWSVLAGIRLSRVRRRFSGR